MKYLKRFNEINEDQVNESLKNMFLIPLLATVGYINAQKTTPKKVDSVLHSKVDKLVLDKSELKKKDLKTLFNEKGELLYDFFKSAGSDVERKDFDNYCLKHNINKDFFDRFLDVDKPFSLNLKDLGKTFQANINISKDIELMFAKDPEANHLGVKLNF